MNQRVAVIRALLTLALFAGIAWGMADRAGILAADEKPKKARHSTTAQATTTQATGAVVAARVGVEVIDVDEVRLAVERGLRGRAVDDAARPRLEAEALELAINQRLVDLAVKREKLAPSPGQIDAAMGKIRQEALAKYATFEAYLEATGQTEALIRRQMAWRWGWRNFLARHVTDELRQRVFDEQRRELDGTEVRVSHILLKFDGTPTESAVAARGKEADALRKRIEAGELTFAEAASRYSGGPSGKDGGDLGFIPRQGSMDEAFAKAAFALEVNQISPPVVTPFGVHLIQCTAVKPGTKEWTDARRELESRVIQRLFAQTAAAERANVEVEYTGAISRIEPAAGEKAEPK